MKIYRFIVASLISLIVLVLWYFGSYLPLKKSQLYVQGLRALQTAEPRSLQEFNNLFDPVLDSYSPIGQDELVASYLDFIINVINQQTDQQLIMTLVSQAERRVAPILEAKKGFNFSQILFDIGRIYQIAAYKLKSQSYYEKSVELYKEGLKFSPNRPIFLYGLFELYKFGGDKEGEKEVGTTILKYWPGDEEVRKSLSY